MRRRTYITAFLIVTLCMPLHAGLLGDLWHGVKSVVSAPVKAVGWLVGQGIDSAVDPALDNAFGRLKETTDHAIDRADSAAGARIAQIDDLAKQRIAQLDDVAKNRINQVDEVLKVRLDQAEHILDTQLTHLEDIGIQLLDREAKILDENVTRVEGILEHTVDRLQEVETDAFDRVDAALQDQVPFAAGQVARTMEWTAAVIVFIVVLVGFGGVELLRRVRTDASHQPLFRKLWSHLAYVPRTLVLVGVPMLFLFGIIQVGYVAYCERSDSGRVARVEDAADLLERAGDFRAATTFRKRALALRGDQRRHFMVVRDQWLSTFWQRRIGQDTLEMLQAFNSLMTDASYSAFARSDPELTAAEIYIKASYFPDQAAGGSVAAIEDYKTRLVGRTSRRPVLGRLVFMSQARISLNDGTKPIEARLKDVAAIADALLAVPDYRRYAPGLVLRSQVAVHLLELERDRLNSSITDEVITERSKKVTEDVEMASAADPNLARYMRFRSRPLPNEVTKNILEWSKKSAQDRAAKEGGDLQTKVAKQINDYAAELERLIRPLLGVEVLSRAKVERQLLYAMRSGVGELQLKEQIEAARKSKRDGKAAAELYAAYKAVSDTAIVLGKLQLAEAWLNESLAITRSSQDAFKQNEGAVLEASLTDVRMRGGVPAGAQSIPSISEIMFLSL